MAMKHRRMNSRTLHSTEDMTESFFLSLERHGKLPDLIQSYLDHMPYCVNAKTNTVPDSATHQINLAPVRLATDGAAVLAAEGTGSDVANDVSDDEFEINKGDSKKIAENENKVNNNPGNKQTKEKLEKVSIREDEEGVTITHHEETGDITRTFAKGSVNWRMYSFLKSQREFNTKCSVPRHIAEKNEKWFFDHSSATLHKRRISVVSIRRKSHYKK
jgi:hypothetical protein